MKDTNSGHLCPRVLVSFNVPSRVAAILPEHGEYHWIISAQIPSDYYLDCAAKSWRGTSNKHCSRTGPVRVAAALSEGCDTKITVCLTVEHWHLIGRICGKLGMTPGAWLLAAAIHNADLDEREIAKDIEQAVAAAEQTEVEP